MPNTDAEIMESVITVLGEPSTGSPTNKNFSPRIRTDLAIREAFAIESEGTPPPTTGQLWPRGDRLSV